MLVPLRRRRAAILAAGLAWSAAPGCGESSPPAATATATTPTDRPSPPRPPARPDGVRTYTLRGVVKTVKPAEGEVTIAHEALPGFMGAMVMPFELKKRELLDDLRPGDAVEGPLVVEFRAGKVEHHELTDLTVTDAAPAPPPPPLAVARKPAPLAIGAEVPDFAVTTQDGTTLHLGDLRGKVVALTFIYTRCPLPDFCPAVDQKFAELNRLASIPADRAARVALLSVSFDPKHDTPEVLRRHAKLRGAKPPWSFAVATAEELARVGPLLGLDYYPESDQFAHNLVTAVVDPDGRLARLEPGRGWAPADLFRTILGLLPPKGRP